MIQRNRISPWGLAILAAVANRKQCRIVISTHTIALQEQIVQKDIPFLQKIMRKLIVTLPVAEKRDIEELDFYIRCCSPYVEQAFSGIKKRFG